MKLSKHIRPSRDLWGYNGDGRFEKERIKGIDKCLLKRRTRRREQREARREVLNES